MNKFHLLILSLLLACGHDKNHNNHQQIRHSYQSFGAEITTENAQDFSELMANFEGDSLKVKVSGTIDAVCQEKGCWLTIADQDHSLRVTFKDYGFFVPKDAAGKEVVIEGILKKTTIDTEMQKHYAKDEGKTAEEIEMITEPKETYAFVAKGVLIASNEESFDK